MQPFAAIHTSRDVAYTTSPEQPVPWSHHTHNQENNLGIGRCLMKKKVLGKNIFPFFSLYPIHSHAAFDPLCILCSVTSISLNLCSPLPCCKHHSHLVLATPEGMGLSLSSLCSWPLAALPHFQALLSRFKWETSAFFKCEGTGKVRHINPLFIYRSGTGQATAISDFLCCFTHPWPLQWPKLPWRVRASSNSASDQLLAHRISCGMAQICQILCSD